MKITKQIAQYRRCSNNAYYISGNVSLNIINDIYEGFRLYRNNSIDYAFIPYLYRYSIYIDGNNLFGLYAKINKDRLLFNANYYL